MERLAEHLWINGKFSKAFPTFFKKKKKSCEMFTGKTGSIMVLWDQKFSDSLVKIDTENLDSTNKLIS